MTIKEHLTGLFIGGFYYWLVGDYLGADTCWKTAVELIPLQYFEQTKTFDYTSRSHEWS